jgi:hypothetical protein
MSRSRNDLCVLRRSPEPSSSNTPSARQRVRGGNISWSAELTIIWVTPRLLFLFTFAADPLSSPQCHTYQYSVGTETVDSSDDQMTTNDWGSREYRRDIKGRKFKRTRLLRLHSLAVGS